MLLFQAAAQNALLSKQSATATIVREDGSKAKVELPEVKVAVAFGNKGNAFFSDNASIPAPGSREVLQKAKAGNGGREQEPAVEFELKHNLIEYSARVQYQAAAFMVEGDFKAASDYLAEAQAFLSSALGGKLDSIREDYPQVAEALEKQVEAAQSDMALLAQACGLVRSTYDSPRLVTGYGETGFAKALERANEKRREEGEPEIRMAPGDIGRINSLEEGGRISIKGLDGSWYEACRIGKSLVLGNGGGFSENPLADFEALPAGRLQPLLGGAYDAIHEYLAEYELVRHAAGVNYSKECDPAKAEIFAAMERTLSSVRSDLNEIAMNRKRYLAHMEDRWGFEGQSKFYMANTLVKSYLSALDYYRAGVAVDMLESGTLAKHVEEMPGFADLPASDQKLLQKQAVAEAEKARQWLAGEKAQMDRFDKIRRGGTEPIKFASPPGKTALAYFALEKSLSGILPAFNENGDHAFFLARGALAHRNYSQIVQFENAFEGTPYDASEAVAGLAEKAVDAKLTGFKAIHTYVFGDEIGKLMRKFDGELGAAYGMGYRELDSKKYISELRDGIADNNVEAALGLGGLYGKSALIWGSTVLNAIPNAYTKAVGGAMMLGLMGWDVYDKEYMSALTLAFAMYGGCKIPIVNRTLPYGNALQALASAKITVEGAAGAVDAIKNGQNYGWTFSGAVDASTSVMMGLMMPAYHGYLGKVMGLRPSKAGPPPSELERKAIKPFGLKPKAQMRAERLLEDAKKIGDPGICNEYVKTMGLYSKAPEAAEAVLGMLGFYLKSKSVPPRKIAVELQNGTLVELAPKLGTGEFKKLAIIFHNALEYKGEKTLAAIENAVSQYMDAPKTAARVAENIWKFYEKGSFDYVNMPHEIAKFMADPTTRDALVKHAEKTGRMDAVDLIAEIAYEYGPFVAGKYTKNLASYEKSTYIGNETGMAVESLLKGEFPGREKTVEGLVSQLRSTKSADVSEGAVRLVLQEGSARTALEMFNSEAIATEMVKIVARNQGREGVNAFADRVVALEGSQKSAEGLAFSGISRTIAIRKLGKEAMDALRALDDQAVANDVCSLAESISSKEMAALSKMLLSLKNRPENAGALVKKVKGMDNKSGFIKAVDNPRVISAMKKLDVEACKKFLGAWDPEKLHPLAELVNAHRNRMIAEAIVEYCSRNDTVPKGLDMNDPKISRTVKSFGNEAVTDALIDMAVKDGKAAAVKATEIIAGLEKSPQAAAGIVQGLAGMNLEVAAKNLTPDALGRIAAFEGTTIAKHIASRVYDAALLEKTLSFAEKFKGNGTGLSGMLDSMQNYVPETQIEVANRLMAKKNAGAVSAITDLETGRALASLAVVDAKLALCVDIIGKFKSKDRASQTIRELGKMRKLDYPEHLQTARKVALETRESLVPEALKKLDEILQNYSDPRIFGSKMTFARFLGEYVDRLAEKSRDNQISEGLEFARPLLTGKPGYPSAIIAFKILEKQMGVKMEGLPDSREWLEAEYFGSKSEAIRAYCGLELGKSGEELMGIFEKSRSETKYFNRMGMTKKLMEYVVPEKGVRARMDRMMADGANLNMLREKFPDEKAAEYYVLYSLFQSPNCLLSSDRTSHVKYVMAIEEDASDPMSSGKFQPLQPEAFSAKALVAPFTLRSERLDGIKSLEIEKNAKDYSPEAALKMVFEAKAGLESSVKFEEGAARSFMLGKSEFGAFAEFAETARAALPEGSAALEGSLRGIEAELGRLDKYTGDKKARAIEKIGKQVQGIGAIVEKASGNAEVPREEVEALLRHFMNSPLQFMGGRSAAEVMKTPGEGGAELINLAENVAGGNAIREIFGQELIEQQVQRISKAFNGYRNENPESPEGRAWGEFIIIPSEKTNMEKQSGVGEKLENYTYEIRPKTFIDLTGVTANKSCLGNDMAGLARENVLLGRISDENGRLVGSAVITLDAQTKSLTIMDLEPSVELEARHGAKIDGLVYNVVEMTRKFAEDNGYVLFAHHKSGNHGNVSNKQSVVAALGRLYGPFEEDAPENVAYGAPARINGYCFTQGKPMPEAKYVPE